MPHRAWVCVVLLLAAAAPAAPKKLYYDPVPIPEEDVLTQHNDNQRTGRTQTSDLSPATDFRQFGFLFDFVVDGDVFAQPLYVSGIDMGENKTGGIPVRNVVFIATMKNKVYAFDAYNSDADPSHVPMPLWEVSLGTPVPNPVELADLGKTCGDIRPDGFIGVLSTPVIDPTRRLMFVVAKTFKAGSPNQYAFTAFKLDLRSGAILGQSDFGGTLEINEPGIHGFIGFNALHHLNRPGLLLTRDNKLLVAFGSHCDKHPYYGWVFLLDAGTLAIEAVHASAIQNGAKGNGIWQAGNGLATAPAAPENLVYFSGGNGDADVSGDVGVNLSHSLVRLCIDGLGGTPCARPMPPRLVDWRADDWFTPSNRDFLNMHDLDFGSSGPTIIPGTAMLYALAGGKEGSLYLTNANNLGHFDSSKERVLQKFQAVTPPGKSCESLPLPHKVSCHIHGSPVWWRPGNGDAIDIFVWGESDHLRGYRLHDSAHRIDETPFATGAEKDCDDCMPGGILSLSSDEQKPGTGLVWATEPMADGNHREVAGQLLAYDAATLRTLWASGYGFMLGKYVPPTVAHDRVFIATHQNRVSVFGIRAPRICEGSRCGMHNGHLCGTCSAGSVCRGRECIPDPCFGHCGQIGEFFCGRCQARQYCNESHRCVCAGAVLAPGAEGTADLCAGFRGGPSDQFNERPPTGDGDLPKGPPQR